MVLGRANLLYNNMLERQIKITLNSLIYCDIYRDGGSLEGAWTTSENKEWVLCLKIDNKKSAFLPFEDRVFTLHNTKLNECTNENKITKDTEEFQSMMNLVSEWFLQANKLQIPSRVNELILALHKGNF